MDKKKKLWVVLVICINLFSLAYTVLDICFNKQETIWIEEEVLYPLSEVDRSAIIGSDFSEEWVRYLENRHIIVAQNLEKGYYSVRINYSTNVDRNYMYFEASGKQSSLLLSDDYLLGTDKTEISVPIWLKDSAEVLKLLVKPQQTPGGGVTDPYFHIDQVTISRSTFGTLGYFLCRTLAFLLLFDFIVLCFYKKEYIKENIYVFLGLGAAILISSLGVLNSDLPQGHDMGFHFARLYGITKGLRTGQFPVRVQPGWSNGYGYGVSIFYGDTLLYLPAILMLLKLPLNTAYRVYVIAVNIGTVLISYFCFKRIGRSKHIGTVCSVIYTLSMYRICNTYLRAAVGEYTAMMFYPLIMLGVWEILDRGGDEKDNKYSWLILAAGMTGIIQSHILSCEMIVIFLVFVCLINIRTVLQKKTFLLFVKSVFMTIGLNAFFLLPFLDYSREEFNVFLKEDFYGIQETGLTLYELFAFTTKGSGNARRLYWDRIPVVLGLTSVLVIMLGIIILAKNRDWKEKEKANVICVLLLTGLSAVMALNLFPWDKLEQIGPLHQLVGTLQFPFRFMAICSLLVALLACLLFRVCERMINDKKFLLILLFGFCFLSAWQSMEFTDRIMCSAVNYGTKYDGRALSEDNPVMVYGGQYFYVGTDWNVIYGENTPKGDLTITGWYQNGNSYTVTCETTQEAILEVPLFYYSDYRCFDIDTGDEYEVVKGENNIVCVNLPENYEGTVRIRFKEPWLWRASEVVSLLTFILFIVIFIKSIDKKRENSYDNQVCRVAR